MTLRWRAWERKLRQRVRTELRATPARWQEFKRHRRKHSWWHRRLPAQFYRLIYWAVAFNFLGRSGVAVETLVAFIWLWALGAMFWRTAQLQSTLYFAPELQVFRHLPISDTAVFEVLWRRFLGKSFWPLLDFAMLYGVLAYRLGAGWQSPLIGLALGGLQALFNVGYAVQVFACGGRRGLPVAAVLCFGGALSLIIFGAGTPGGLALVTQVAGWLPPSGWIFYALGISVSHGMGPDLLPNLLAGLALAAFPWAVQRLRCRYVLTEETFTQAFRLTATGEAGALRLQEYAASFAQPAEAVSAGLRAGALRERMDWAKTGWVERQVARVLTKRERELVEYLTAGQPGWTKNFRTLLILGVLALATVKLFPALAGFSVFFFLAYGGVAVFGLGPSFGRGFGLSAPVGLPPPYYAYLPLGFAELHRCVLKVMLLRFGLVTPVLLGLVAVFNVLLGTSVGAVWLMTGKVFGLVLLAHPALAIFAFSPGTNDTNRWAFLLPTLIYVILALGCAVGVFFAPNGWGTGLFATLFAALSWGAKWLYQRAYDHGLFDLFPAKRAENSTPGPH